jgi:hypothetical protein
MARHLRPTSVFLSYAHEDEWLLKELMKHLSLLQRQGLISAWYDQQIVPGTDRIKAIEQQLEQAAIILLLVSIDFLASDYYYQIEMEHALKRHKAGEARVIPILVRPANWKETPLANLQVLPTDGKAISIWRNRDSAFVNVEKGIRHAIKDLSSSSLSVRHNNKGYENGNKPPVNWAIPRFSTKSYIIFLIILILTFSASFFYVLRMVPDSGRTSPPNTTSSSARTASSPIATEQPTPRHTYSDIHLVSPTTPLMIPCVDNCIPGFNVAVILERVDFDNSSNDGVVVTFQFTTEKANICSSIDVNVLKLEPPKPINDDHTINDIQGHIFSIGSLDTGRTELKANFSFVPGDNIPYQLSLVLSCQANNPMFYQKITLAFKVDYVTIVPTGNTIPESITISTPIAIFVISPLEVLIAFLIIIFAFTTIRWLAQSSPFGILTKPKVTRRRTLKEEKDTLSIILGAERSLRRKLISKSTISCEELELASKGHFNFYGRKFDLVFKRGRQVYIRVRRNHASSIGLQRHGEIRMVNIDHHRRERLLDGDIINIGGEDIAVFSVSKTEVF